MKRQPVFACGKWLHLGSLGSSEITREDRFEPRFSLFCRSLICLRGNRPGFAFEIKLTREHQVSLAVTETQRLVWCDCWGGQTGFRSTVETVLSSKLVVSICVECACPGYGHMVFQVRSQSCLKVSFSALTKLFSVVPQHFVMYFNLIAAWCNFRLYHCLSPSSFTWV